MAFHVRDGWFFQRQPDGSVDVSKRNPQNESEVVAGLRMSSDEWASVLTEVCRRPFHEAVDFHTGVGKKKS